MTAPRWAFERMEEARAKNLGAEPNALNVDVFMRDPSGWNIAHAFAAHIADVEDTRQEVENLTCLLNGMNAPTHAGPDQGDSGPLVPLSLSGRVAALVARMKLAKKPRLHADDVQWVVNDNAELGVKIGDQFFFLYKGDSLVYDPPEHDDGKPMHWRAVGKREFGECCHPINYANLNLIGTVSLDDCDRWQVMKPDRAAVLSALATQDGELLP